jgi:MscS family membrane protein
LDRESTSGTTMRTSVPMVNLTNILRYFTAVLLTVGVLLPANVKAQSDAQPPAPAAPQPPAPIDILGRNTPRGTVLGFLSAASKSNDETAARYLNTGVKGRPAEELAHQLFVVLNRRLSAELYQLSNRPEGSLADPNEPNLELVGTISSTKGDVEILLERLDRGKGGSVWLFSSKTLDSVPDLYQEVNTVPVERVLPRFLTETRVGGVALFEWLAVFVGMPLFYLLTGLLNQLLSHLVGLLRRWLRKTSELPDPQILQRPVRLLMLGFFIRWLLSRLNLPLLARQFWSTTATIITIAASVWLFILLNDWLEEILRLRLAHRVNPGITSVVRLGRRVVDLLAIFVGVLFGLHHFGVNPTAALAGLSVGGIAVALAAQKTLENLLGGTSIILDRVMSVGDRVKIGDAEGTVEDVGLRSTRIRTNDRTVVSVPNGQIASASLENFSTRDKFWFHQILSLGKETSSSQMRSFVESATKLITQHPNAERTSVRVSFLRLGTFSLDVEIVAYILARDWGHFLQIQGDLLLQVMEILQEASIQMAVQPHAVSLMAPTSSDGDSAQALAAHFATDEKATKWSPQGTVHEGNR